MVMVPISKVSETVPLRYRRVLEVLRGYFGPFYLTGGAALSMYYLPGRPHTDIDLVAFQEPDFQSATSEIIALLIKEFSIPPDHVKQFKGFVRIPLPGTPPVNMELINDIDVMWGEPVIVDGVPIDSLSNILINKLNCIQERNNLRDRDDLTSLFSSYSFSRFDAFSRARRKSMLTQATMLGLMVEKLERLHRVLGDREPADLAREMGIPLPWHLDYHVVFVEFRKPDESMNDTPCHKRSLIQIIEELRILSENLRRLAPFTGPNGSAEEEKLPMKLCYVWGGLQIRVKRLEPTSEKMIASKVNLVVKS